MNVPAQRPNGAGGANGTPASTPVRTDLGDGWITGNLTFDPELRFTPSGRAVANVRVAYTARVQDKASGTWQDSDPEYYDVQVWGRMAEHAAEHLQRGDRIVAAGTWQEETYTARDGQERTRLRLIARDMGPSMLFRAVHIQRGQVNGHSRPAPPGANIARPAGYQPAPDGGASDE